MSILSEKFNSTVTNVKIIPHENIRQFLMELDHIFYNLKIDDFTWSEFDEITEKYLGADIRERNQEAIMVIE